MILRAAEGENREEDNWQQKQTDAKADSFSKTLCQVVHTVTKPCRKVLLPEQAKSFREGTRRNLRIVSPRTYIFGVGVVEFRNSKFSVSLSARQLEVNFGLLLLFVGLFL